MIVGVVAAATPSVVTVKVAEVAPAAIVTLAGTVAAAVLDEESVTTAPPGCAFPVSVSVPVDEAPATTVVGARARPAIAAGVTVRVAVFGVEA